MTNELQSLNEKIAEKVGGELLDLIPPDKWRALVDDQVKVFMTHKAPAIIHNELETRLRKSVATLLSSPEYGDEWDNTSHEMVNLAVKDMLIRSAPEIFSAMLAPMMSGVMSDLRNRLQLNQY